MAPLDNYEVIELLGRGSTGDVYACYDKRLERLVAIKELRSDLLSDSEAVERFQAEGKILAQLNHQNIACVYAVERTNNSFHIIMEIANGVRLDEFIQKVADPSHLKCCLAVALQVAEGLSHAHKKGVVHRDIKPSNIIINNEGVVKILDFGVAVLGGSSRLTQHGSAVGTPVYMSPEQCLGEKGDHRSDIYSFSATIFEIITGQAPFISDDISELMHAHINRKPVAPSTVLPSVPKNVDAAILKALSKNPENRFPDVMEFARAIGAESYRSSGPSLLCNIMNSGLDGCIDNSARYRLSKAQKRLVFIFGVVLAVLSSAIALRISWRVSDNERAASYLCRDGSYSFSRHRTGACSWHGGVGRALD